MSQASPDQRDLESPLDPVPLVPMEDPPSGGSLSSDRAADSPPTAPSPAPRPSPDQPPQPKWGLAGWLIRLLPVALPMALFIFAGIRGIDFGVHWDEQDHIQSVHDSLQKDIYLPMGAHAYDAFPGLKGGYYGYPSLIYWVTLFSAAPEIVRHHDDLTSPKLLDYINSQEFLIRVRKVCVAISSLMILWIYIAVLSLRRNTWLALFAAFLVAGSWELGYHSRWLATDVLAVQFAAMCLMFCVLALQNREKTFRWIQLAAVAAGLATGAKYPAGAMIVPVLITTLLAPGNKVPLRRLPLQIIQLILILGGVFLLTTPGALLQPTHFMRWLDHDRLHYSSGGHGPYTILHHLLYFRTAFIYLGMVLFSRFAVIAMILAALGYASLLWLIPRWRLAAVLLIFPVLYVAYLSQQVVFICRNMLILSPFLVLLSALGVAAIFDLLRPLWLRRSVAGLLAVCLLINTGWVLYAAESVHRNRDPGYEINQVADYLESHANERTLVTPGVNALLDKYHRKTWPVPAGALAQGSTPPDFLITNRDESNGIYLWPANKHDLLPGWFGPYEVNLNYYPDWMRSHIYKLPYPLATTIEPARAVIDLMKRSDEVAAHAPPGYKLTAYFDCGGQTVARTDDFLLYQATGAVYVTPTVDSQSMTFCSQSFGSGDILFMAKLNPKKQYIVGAAWWDFEGAVREQRLLVGGPGIPPRMVVPAQRLPRWLNNEGKPPEPPRELTFEIPPDVSLAGEARIIVRGFSPQSSVVISDLWVLEKPLEPGAK